MGEKVLMKGNEAIGEAAIRSGCRHFFGYPITPQTELSAYMAKKMPKINGVFLQAESEVSAINMVYGAAAAGMRNQENIAAINFLLLLGCAEGGKGYDEKNGKHKPPGGICGKDEQAPGRRGRKFF